MKTHREISDEIEAAEREFRPMRKIVEIHTKEAVDAEVERMKRSPEMLWWLGLFSILPITDDLLRTEAYNRLTERRTRDAREP